MPASCVPGAGSRTHPYRPTRKRNAAGRAAPSNLPLPHHLCRIGLSAVSNINRPAMQKMAEKSSRQTVHRTLMLRLAGASYHSLYAGVRRRGGVIRFFQPHRIYGLRLGLLHDQPELPLCTVLQECIAERRNKSGQLKRLCVAGKKCPGIAPVGVFRIQHLTEAGVGQGNGHAVVRRYFSVLLASLITGALI